jgi:acyl-CoA dehydrogenase
MSDNETILADTATRLFQDLSTPLVVNAAEAGVFPDTLWDTLEEAGLTLTWVPERRGGTGAEIADGFTVIRIAAQFSAPVPIAETLMAGLILAEAGIDVPTGRLTVAPVLPDERIELTADGKLRGAASAIPFARSAAHIAVLVHQSGTPMVALVAADACTIGEDTSLAGEPRDPVGFDGVKPLAIQPASFGQDAIVALGAAVRSMQMAGALDRILNLSVQYATDRVQFGRPIGKFQVVQHNLAILAGEVAAATAAAGMGAEALAGGLKLNEAAIIEIAAAKLRAGEAASTGAAIAHQAHGAMGFTYEHALHHATRRLWSWRDEFGTESEWAIRLGRLFAAKGADALWPEVTGTGDS